MIDIDLLARTYFFFDKSVPYQVEGGQILISPVYLIDSEIFTSSLGLLTIDKNSISNVDIIKMTYLDFIVKVLFASSEENVQRFINIVKLCLNIDEPYISLDEKESVVLIDKRNQLTITGKQFDDIKRIILYQNLPHYDDSYIDPEMKQSMAEVDELKNRDIVFPSLERKIAIITSHSGLSKKEQLSMTYRSHEILFEEVCGEVEYLTSKAIALYTGQSDKIENWVYKKNKNKFDDYFVSAKKFSKTMGGDGNIKSTDSNIGDI